MPVPSSGQLRLRADIANEVDGSATDDNVSLGTLSNTAGFAEPDAMSDFYGYTSAVAPTVTSLFISSPGPYNLVWYATVSSDGGATVTDCGFYMGTSSNYASNTKYSVTSGTGQYYKNFQGLTPNTLYYATAYAINSAGEGVSTTLSYRTPSLITYSFQNNTQFYRAGETSNFNANGGYARAYGAYNHAQLGYQTTNSCINGSVTSDGHSPPNGISSNNCVSGTKSMAYFPFTTGTPRTSRVIIQHGGTGTSSACCADNYIQVFSNGSCNNGGYGGDGEDSFTVSANYGSSNNLNSGFGCTGGGTGGCPYGTGSCNLSFSLSAAFYLS